MSRGISVNTVYEALGRFVVRFRWGIVVFWIVVAAVTGAALPAISRTGSTVTSAGIILGGTSVVFAVIGGSGAGNGQLHAIGVGLAAGILMGTFLVRTLLVPSVVVLLGRWNWWPSRLSLKDPAAAPARR